MHKTVLIVMAAIVGVFALAVIAQCGSGAAPIVQATIYSSDTCAACLQMIREIKAELPKDGWVIRDITDVDVATAHVVITKRQQDLDASGITALPTTILRRAGKVVRRIEGRLSPDQLVEMINAEAKK